MNQAPVSRRGYRRLWARDPRYGRRYIELLLPLSPRSAFDVVNALGVLHHTHDTGAALRAAGAIVAPGGILHVGLYHRHGRAPFLALFDPWREGPVGDVPPEHHAAAFARYRSLNHHVDDELLLHSWFVDQVLYLVERSHSLTKINTRCRSGTMSTRADTSRVSSPPSMKGLPRDLGAASG